MSLSPLGSATLTPLGRSQKPVRGVFDQFTDTDLTALVSHTIAPRNTPGASWTEPRGAFEISGNQLRPKTLAGATVSAEAIVNVGVADFVVRVKVTPVSNLAGNFIVFRYVDPNNFLFVTPAWSASQLRIIRRQAGANTTLNSTAISFTAGQHQLQVTVSGSAITAILDDSISVSTTSTFQQTTATAGLRDQSIGDLYDDFEVII